jgi:hypothetical protein
MKQIKLKLLVFEDSLKDSKGKAITHDIADMLREAGEDVVEGESLSYKDITFAFNTLPPFILIGEQTSPLISHKFTIMQGLTEDIMFNFLETPEEIMHLINDAEDKQLNKELNSFQLEIPFTNGQTEINSSEG